MSSVGENTAATTSADCGGESSIDELQAEIEQLKQRIADERQKLCDKTAALVAESIEPIVGLNIKARRSVSVGYHNKCNWLLSVTMTNGIVAESHKDCS